MKRLNHVIVLTTLTVTDQNISEKYPPHFDLELNSTPGRINQYIRWLLPGADPGFPVGGGANLPRGGQHIILLDFPKNSMKLRKIWSVGGRPPALVPPLTTCIHLCVCCFHFLF